MKKKILNLMTFSFLGLLAISCGNKDQQPQGPSARPYPVTQVQEKNIVGYDNYPATIEGKINNQVRAKIQGYIRQLYVDEGQVVKKGQLLFRLETNVLTQEASAAKSGINAAQSSISAAQAAVNAAQVEVDRLTPLVQKNIISNVQLETAKANLMQAQSQLQQAQANYHQAQANYGSVQANINFSEVRSPVDGVVGSLPYREGSLVGPSDPTPLTVISDITEVYAYFSMNESQYLSFFENVEGKTVKEKLSNLPEVQLQLVNKSIYAETGKIEAVTGQIDRTTGTIQFRATFKNNGLLNNGNSGTIRIPRNYDNALVVPEAATYEQQGVVYLYKVTKDTAHATPIKVVDRVDQMALVNSGVQKGDSIVASGITTLRDRAAIIPQPVDFDSIVNAIKPVF